MKIRVQVPMPELGENVAKAIDVEIPMFEMAEFEKVSYEQFKKDMNEFKDMFTEDMMKEMYDNIKLPERSTNWLTAVLSELLKKKGKLFKRQINFKLLSSTQLPANQE